MKENPDILKYLTRKKWSYTESAGQYVVAVCPYCGDRKGHFYINKVTSQCSCWKCEHAGNLYTLKKDLGDIVKLDQVAKSDPKLSKKVRTVLGRKVRGWHNALKANKEARKIIKKKWGWGIEAIKAFKLGLERQGKINWLVYPQIEGGKLVNVKYRALPPAQKRFKRSTGGKSILYNVDNLDPSLNYVILVEGESDTITAHSYLGLKNVLGVTVGARGFAPEWKDLIDQFEKVYLVYDNDVVGQQGAEKIAGRLGFHKCFNVLVPQPDDADKRVDLTDWWSSGNSVEHAQKLLASASAFDVKDILSFSKVLDDIEAELYFNKRLDSQGLLSPWSKVNKLVGGFIPGDLVVVSAPAKTGKTTFCMNLLIEWAKQGIPVLLYELEMRPERTGAKIITYLRGIDRKQITRDDVVYVKTIFGRKPFYLAHSYNFTVEQVFDTIRESVRRYGIEALCFDHLHFLVRATENVSHTVSVTVRDFKLLAEELKIPIILICQPRKPQGKTLRMTYDDLKDSSSIGQDADTVIILYRERIPVQKATPGGEDQEDKPVFRNDTEVIVDATRWNPGGSTMLWFNGSIGKFFDDLKGERSFLNGRRG